MNNSKQPIVFEDGELAEFASNVLLSTFEASVAIASGNPFSIAISAGHILKNSRGFIKLKSVALDMLSMKKNGVLSDETIKSELAQENLIELMDSLEKDTMTQEKFDVLRRIFLQGLINIQAKKHEILSREFLVQARKLEPSEILILSSIWNKGHNIQPHAKDEDEFLRKVEAASTLPTEICHIYILKLSEKGFIKMFTNNLGWNCEITTFGRQFCSFVTEFERMEKGYLANT